MSNARNLARVIVDSSGDIAANNLDNAIPADGSITAAKLAASLDLSSKTLTYPDNSVQSADIVSLAASKLSSQVPFGNAPSGSVIQCVHSSGNTTFATSSTSFIDSPQSIVITPKLSTSKIVIQMVNAFWSATSYYMYARIVASGGASGTIVSYGDWYSGYYGNTPITGVHSGHNTTSAITYKLQGRADGGSWYMPNNNPNADTSTRYFSIAWEIAP